MDEDNALFIDGVQAGMRGSAGPRPFRCARRWRVQVLSDLACRFLPRSSYRRSRLI